MTSDSSKPIVKRPRPDWRLPNILDIEIQQIDYIPSKLQYFKSSLSQYDKAIQFIVKTDQDIPIRALSAVLFIGDEQVIESMVIDKHKYQFLAFKIEQLEIGKPISWGWINDPEEKRQPTKFKYNL